MGNSSGDIVSGSLPENPDQKKPIQEPLFKICYRVIDDEEGIRSALHLRYVTYRHVNFIAANEDLIDVDAYDYYSTILGAYHIDEGHETLIGTMRIVSRDRESKTAPIIDKFIKTAKSEKIRARNERSRAYPILESFNLPKDFPDGRGDVNLVEISRLAVRPDYWFRRIDVGLHHLLILNSWQTGLMPTYFMVAVHPRARARYERIGMQSVPDTGTVMYRHVDQLAVAMYVELDTLLRCAQNYRHACETDYPAFKQTGRFCRTVEKRLPIDIKRVTD